eukprot:c5454_g1_i2.p1 GENE.c5454_g1_i2~~c5454_g1_i2.p1  ORF type:complete len:515 (+),score=112.32 c5454_g1_i2:227-1546(+)
MLDSIKKMAPGRKHHQHSKHCERAGTPAEDFLSNDEDSETVQVCECAGDAIVDVGSTKLQVDVTNAAAVGVSEDRPSSRVPIYAGHCGISSSSSEEIDQTTTNINTSNNDNQGKHELPVDNADNTANGDLDEAEVVNLSQSIFSVPIEMPQISAEPFPIEHQLNNDSSQHPASPRNAATQDVAVTVTGVPELPKRSASADAVRPSDYPNLLEKPMCPISRQSIDRHLARSAECSTSPDCDELSRDAVLNRESQVVISRLTLELDKRDATILDLTRRLKSAQRAPTPTPTAGTDGAPLGLELQNREALRTELNSQIEISDQYDKVCKGLLARVADLEAENKRLVDANSSVDPNSIASRLFTAAKMCQRDAVLSTTDLEELQAVSIALNGLISEHSNKIEKPNRRIVKRLATVSVVAAIAGAIVVITQPNFNLSKALGLKA